MKDIVLPANPVLNLIKTNGYDQAASSFGASDCVSRGRRTKSRQLANWRAGSRDPQHAHGCFSGVSKSFLSRWVWPGEVG